MKTTIALGAIATIACVLTGCERSASNATVSETAAIADYAGAVASAARTDQDRARDEGRQPAKVLKFFGLQPGMKVLDMFAGGGYYTEIISYVVGPDGSVISHSNETYRNFVGDEATRRYADDRLANVSILMAENNELVLPSEEFDAITLILAYHDIYYAAPNDGWPKIDGPRLLAELYKGLKPGGVLGVVDHIAEAGSPRETGGTLHRIDPAIVVAEMKMAGFRFDGESSDLRNPEEDHLLHMADPAVRGKTDRAVMRFIRPES
jgi:predicted methyltransferase